MVLLNMCVLYIISSLALMVSFACLCVWTLICENNILICILISSSTLALHWPSQNQHLLNGAGRQLPIAFVPRGQWWSDRSFARRSDRHHFHFRQVDLFHFLWLGIFRLFEVRISSDKLLPLKENSHALKACSLTHTHVISSENKSAAQGNTKEHKINTQGVCFQSSKVSSLERQIHS